MFLLLNMTILCHSEAFDEESQVLDKMTIVAILRFTQYDELFKHITITTKNYMKNIKIFDIFKYKIL